MLLREPARPAVIREHPMAPWLAVATVCFGAFMGQLDASVVTLAFPALQRQFGVALAGVQWVSLAYLLALVALLVPVGRWSDRYGRKLVYLYGFVLFTAASAGCGLAPTLGVLVVVRVVQAAGAGLVWWERRAAAPLVDLRMPAASGTWPLLAGALCAYLVLFGPLVLIPQVLTARGGSVVHAGLLLSALPAGFGLAAVAGENILPARWPDRRRCLAGGMLAVGCAAALAIPAPDMVIATWLGLLGVGLGTYIPANNTAIMTAIPPGQAAAAGGMVNMARGLGTALGVAVVTLALHAAARLGHPSAGPAAAMAALAMCALASARAGRRVGRRNSRTVSAVPAIDALARAIDRLADTPPAGQDPR
jgi:MFS family permease